MLESHIIWYNYYRINQGVMMTIRNINDFKKRYPDATSGDLQAFAIGFEAGKEFTNFKLVKIQKFRLQSLTKKVKTLVDREGTDWVHTTLKQLQSLTNRVPIDEHQLMMIEKSVNYN